ncbi:lysozyme inhibitor LprI family protein [Dyella koreensis]|uniref:DUF1311 domain-containing protein n=1 Tax=Dyella koreensis TaxID=311235 RepID=A0ABW8K6U1_9GAMM
MLGKPLNTTRRCALRAPVLLGLVFALIVAVPYGASAASAPQQETGNAIAHDYDLQDARLNAAYRKLVGSLDVAQRKALRDEERQWIAARDKVCGKGAVPGGAVKNACAVAKTSERADELERRVSGASVVDFDGSFGYRSDCNSGHYVEFAIKDGGPNFSGTWSDGTRVGGDFGDFSGQVREGKLYVRFCTAGGGQKGLPLCPSFPEQEGAYFVSERGALTWYRPVGTGASRTFEKYLVLHRVDHGAKAPLDTQCSEDN